MSDKPSTEEGSGQNEPASTRIGIKRPLVPVVLALMLGLVAAAWGLHIPRIWLLTGLTGLLGVLFLFWIWANPRK